MTREEQITETAYKRYFVRGITGCEITHYDIKEAFCMGAEWADSHPCWHKYPDEKPKERGRYLVLFREENHMYVGEYSTKTEEFFMLEDVKAWIELPKLPKFD